MTPTQPQPAVQQETRRKESNSVFAQTLQDNWIFISVVVTCSMAIGLFALRSPNEETTRYRSELAELRRVSSAEIAEWERLYHQSQTELLATQKSLIANEEALTQNINAIRQIQGAHISNEGAGSSIAAVEEASRSDTKTSLEEADNLRHVFEQLDAVRSAKRRNLAAFRDNAFSLAKSKLDLAVDSETLANLKNPRSAPHLKPAGSKWEDYLTPADKALLSDPDLNDQKESSFIKSPVKDIPEKADETRLVTIEMVKRLVRAEAQLTEIENEIGQKQKQLLESQSDLKDVRDQIAKLVAKGH